MSTQPLEISHHHAQQNGIEYGRRVLGHRLTVKGIYYAKSDKRGGGHGGAAARREVEYEESFDLPPSEACLTDTNALSSILSGKALEDRLREKDPEFRGIKTHVIVSHENLLEPAEPLG